MGSSSLPVISHSSVGVEHSARGCSRWWEGSSGLTGQLPPASSWAAPRQLGNKTTQRKRPALKLGCWNVHTMLTGLSGDIRDIDDLRKTAVINNELLRLDVDIAALQETRLADSGTLKEKDYTFYWQGKAPDSMVWLLQ
ncbi:hypothetical protein QQF64_018433 [Cirrhinus molitorella]|uniref:Endonuclease/exonuclease/phosphatase domain-containing protein n=1 Tax=Cirrhinus molitorella TaxID=172907 RepID=A0ABR3LCL7_9TELE